jgi:hypothetical protein
MNGQFNRDSTNRPHRRRLATFFIYCNLAGPTLCPFYTGSTPKDIFVRSENIVGQLNATYAFEKGWANATTIELLLYDIKALLFTEVYNPIDTFPIIAYSLLSNLSSLELRSLILKRWGRN